MPEFFIAEPRLGPSFAIRAVGFGRFLKIRKRVLTIVFRKKSEAVAEILDGFCAFIAAGRNHQFTQRELWILSLRGAIELRDPFWGDSEVHTLPASNLQSRDPNYLAVHVDDGAAARSRRDGRGDLNDAAKSRNVAHGGNNPVGDAALQTKRITDNDDAFAFLRRRAIERKRSYLVRRRVNF